MKKLILPTLFGIGLICVGCGGDNNSIGTQEKQGGTSGTLYQKYGGQAFVTKVIDDSATAILADCTQNPYFTMVLNTPGHDTTDKLKACLDLQLSAAMGAPVTYPGVSQSRNPPEGGWQCEDMTTIHNGLGIPSNVFDQFVTDVNMVLIADGMSAKDAVSLGPKLLGLKPQIVAPAGQTKTYNYTPNNPPGNGCTH